MKAQFIRHKDPWRALGLSILNKRNFKNSEEFITWLYKYVVPDFYGMSNGRDLYHKLKTILGGSGLAVPHELYEYIEYKIVPEISFEDGTTPEVLGWPLLLRGMYPFSEFNDDL